MRLSGICESCVFGVTRLAENCPHMGELLMEHFKNTDEMWLSKCMYHKPVDKPVDEEVTNLQSSSTEEPHCEVL